MHSLPSTTSLSDTIASALMQRIVNGTYAHGDKLPSNAELCEEFGVSRTVVREALASLKLGGRIVSRQGSGVFVSDRGQKMPAMAWPLPNIRACLEILEFRIGVEMQAAALAAQRRTPATLQALYQAHAAFADENWHDTEKEALADFGFHLAIARAAGNPRFAEFLQTTIAEICRDLHTKYTESAKHSATYFAQTVREHTEILAAISDGDATLAQTRMQLHLEDGLNRYRRLLSTAR
ncbi:FadR/GntR family transcriptional regulator [Acetobacter sp.]|uniref:FadR/GntR family transcriptional regulator n=1 Tax=Acetobacter sp. TaxID=440 RepID=UPI0039E98DE5